ncbi:hypothetical protein UFOVP543_23 [uncultured Caudovirales phage]|uniref:Uncharacterized protein n=1 Tax=uncultured Caudovirales phage TaxID=2100421 RepID=A0A6J5MV61_9CAUD|nr:hypothetical protein UFOVP543_23 [uncultured Caudovirales phage]CAB4163765.1 hypothetical protein UFOVP804_51 [uncultured Caudovirales phage]
METDTHKNVVIMIAGYAGAGKDTLADQIMSNLNRKDKYNCVFKVKLKFADILKETLGMALNHLGFSDGSVIARSEDRSIKENIRPILVSLGRFARSKYQDVFADRLCDHADTINDSLPKRYSRMVNVGTARPEKGPYLNVMVVSDLRYINEVMVFKLWAENKGYILHTVYIERGECSAANEEEHKSIKELLDSDLCFHSYVTAPNGVLEPINEASLVITDLLDI